MAHYAPLTAGLRHVTQLQELQPGDLYVIRFKNPLRGYRTDVWLAVIWPDGFELNKALARRPKGSKPTDGSTWATPLGERDYPVFLPARNSFRWVNISDLFVLDKKPPRVYAEGSSRPEGKLFRRLQEIALQDPGLEFWQQIAIAEMQKKGKRGKSLSLVLPEGYEDMLAEDPEETTDEVTSSTDGSDLDLPELRDDEAPTGTASGLTWTPSRPIDGSASRPFSTPTVLTFPGESSPFFTYPQGVSPAQTGSKRKRGKTTDAADLAVVRRTQFPSSARQSLSSQGRDATQTLTKTEDDAVSDDEKKSIILSLDLRSALEHVLLQGDDAHDILVMCRDLVSIQVRNKLEADKVRSWLKIREFVPRLVQLNDQELSSIASQSSAPSTESFGERSIGDVQGIHRKYHLEVVSDSKALGDIILSLGKLYHAVRHFALDGLVDLITRKLQVAWNSYPGISQLAPILEVTAMAFSGSPNKRDNLRTWLVAFIADTLDLHYYACSDKYWEVMRGNRSLHDEVCHRRNDLIQGHPERYADVRAMLRSRGIEEY